MQKHVNVKSLPGEVVEELFLSKPWKPVKFVLVFNPNDLSMKTHLISISLLTIMFFMSCKSDDLVIGPDACALEPEVGPCEALIPKFYFDTVSCSCKSFDWGGCDGVVPFDTMEACEACECA